MQVARYSAVLMAFSVAAVAVPEPQSPRAPGPVSSGTTPSKGLAESKTLKPGGGGTSIRQVQSGRGGSSTDKIGGSQTRSSIKPPGGTPTTPTDKTSPKKPGMTPQQLSTVKGVLDNSRNGAGGWYKKAETQLASGQPLTQTQISDWQRALKAQGQELKTDRDLAKANNMNSRAFQTIGSAERIQQTANKAAGAFKPGRAENARDLRALAASEGAIYKALGYTEEIMGKP